MPIDPNVFNNIKTFADYNRADQDFQLKKALEQQQLQSADTQNQLQNFQLQQAKTTGALQLLGGVNDDSTYQAAKQQAVQRFGIDPSTLPANYDPNWVKTTQNQLLDAKDRATLALENSKLAETQRHNVADEYNASGGWGAPPATTAIAPGNVAPNGIPAAPAGAPINNPGNMRPIGASSGFQQFATPEDGMNAMIHDLTLKATGKSQAMGDKPATLRNIISTWAPAGDGNNPDAYTAFVAQKTGLNPDSLVNPMDIPGKIAPAMAQFEGNKYSAPTSPPKDLNSLQGDEFLAELKRQNPNAPIAQIKAIADGNQPFPSPYALAKNPGMQKIANAVYQVDPTYDANRYTAMQQFTNPNSKTAQAIKSFNVGLAHLDTLSNLADALNNGDTKAINAVGNTVQTQLGVPAPTNFEAAKQIVADEIIKAIVGAGGGVGDRENAQKQISAASSPEQLHGVIDTYKTLMKGQLGGIEQQYQNATGKTDFAKRMLSPEAQAAINPVANTMSTNTSAVTSTPKIGQTMASPSGTYLFNGGDPADKNNWKKVK